MKKPLKKRVPKEKLGLTSREVKKYLSTRIMIKFYKWISHQTCPVLPHGETGYYIHDVERFADMLLEGKPTYWD